MAYRMGIDGGGTQMRALVRASGAARAFRGGPANINGNGKGAVRENLRLLLAEVEAAIGPIAQCESACVGMAGLSHPETAGIVEATFAAAGFQGALRVVGDQEIAHCGALSGRPGAILISGTGSVCYGINAQGEVGRTGGFGYLLDDAGSGYDIGRMILSSVARAWDGRIGPTLLTELVAQAGVGDTAALVAAVYDAPDPKGKIAGFARLLPEACMAQDACAWGIAQRAAEALAELYEPLILRLSLQEEALCLMGGVMTHHAAVRCEVERRAQLRFPALHCTALESDAVHGALLLAELQGQT